MSLFDRISVDVHNVINHYETLRLRGLNENQAQRELGEMETVVGSIPFPNVVFRPVILETIEAIAIPLHLIAAPVVYGAGFASREDVAEVASAHWSLLKHSPVAITAALVLAGSHSKTALATLVGAYLVKKILD